MLNYVEDASVCKNKLQNFALFFVSPPGKVRHLQDYRDLGRFQVVNRAQLLSDSSVFES